MDVFIIRRARNEAQDSGLSRATNGAQDSGWSRARRRGPGDGAELWAIVGVALVHCNLANAVFFGSKKLAAV